MTTFEFGTRYEKGFTIFALVLLSLSLFVLIGFSIIIYHNRDNYENEEFLEKYGELLADVHPHSKGAAFFWVAFMLQRMAQCVIIVFLQGNSVF